MEQETKEEKDKNKNKLFFSIFFYSGKSEGLRTLFLCKNLIDRIFTRVKGKNRFIALTRQTLVKSGFIASHAKEKRRVKTLKPLKIRASPRERVERKKPATGKSSLFPNRERLKETLAVPGLQKNKEQFQEVKQMSNYHRTAARKREEKLSSSIPIRKDSGVRMSKATERRLDAGSQSTNAEDGAGGGRGIRRDMQMIKNAKVRNAAGYATSYDSNEKVKKDFRAYKNATNRAKRPR